VGLNELCDYPFLIILLFGRQKRVELVVTELHGNWKVFADGSSWEARWPHDYSVPIRIQHPGFEPLCCVLGRTLNSHAGAIIGDGDRKS